jgi:hypothetical protein
MLHKIKGGSIDTELKLLTVAPTGLPSLSKQVMTVTPVAKDPSALRNALLSMLWLKIDS